MIFPVKQKKATKKPIDVSFKIIKLKQEIFKDSFLFLFDFKIQCLWFFIYSQTCIKGLPLGQRKSGLLKQVTS
jgi:hypothetical protein